MSIRILVADDEPNQLELLTYNLTQADFEVIRAEDGQQALDMIDEHRPDLVIIDWMMPHMSGIDVCRTLRHGARPNAFRSSSSVRAARKGTVPLGSISALTTISRNPFPRAR